MAKQFGIFCGLIIACLLVCNPARAAEHYVDLNSTNPTPPYSTWATAATDIQDAVDAAVDGDTIWLTNGTYVVTSEITVTNDITIQSVNGPEVTMVDGGGSNRCFNLGDSSCLLEGLTIQNGSTSGSGGGINCLNETPVITNCTIRGNLATYGGGIAGGTVENCLLANNIAAHGGGMHLGTANHCVFEGNEAYDDGGGMFYGTANYCTFQNNKITDPNAGWSANGGGGKAFGLAANCIFTENSASNHFGGGAFGCIVFNSTFIDNSSRVGGGIASVKANSHASGAYGLAINCTFVGNRAEHGGGLSLTPSTNCIAWYNTASIEGNNIYDAKLTNILGEATFIYDIGDVSFICSPDVNHGQDGNITNAPIFVDPAAGDYRLQSNSPCINWGSNAYVDGTTDLDGNPRIVGAHVDMGAYEFQADLGPDSDGNGLPDDWERAYFGYRVLPSENPDGDSASNGNEYIAGTDPTDAASLFVVTNASLSAEGYVVQWDPEEGRSYSVWWSDALTNDFQRIATGLPYPVNSYTDTLHTVEGASFYQLVVELAD